MIKYKINVIEELKKVGVNTMLAKQTGIFSQSTMMKFKNGDTSITVEMLNRLCCILEMQPRDILKFVEVEEDQKRILEVLEKYRQERLRKRKGE